MNINNIFKFVVIILLFSFIFLIFASQSGYYEYELKEKRRLTDEAILRFEKDVSEGKDIDINNYLDNATRDYNNKISKLGGNVSNTIESIISKGFSYLFKYINNQIEK